MPPHVRPRLTVPIRHLLATVTACTLVISGCTSSSTDTPTDPGSPATISISIDPSSGSIEQGGSAVITGTATIGGAFSGTVTFSITGLPAGVTGSVGTVSVSGTTATAPITVEVGAAVAPGTYSGTITAAGSGVSDDAAYSLIVTAAAAGAISLSAISDLTLQQGSSDTRMVTIERTGGFTGEVTLAVEGAPSGLTATPAPATTAGNSSTITLDASGNPAAGTYSLTVRGTAAGVTDATSSFDVTITTAPMGTAVSLDFSACTTDERPVWLAYKDGAGSWMPVTGVNDTYDFTVSEDIVGITVVLESGADTDLSVDYFGRTEIPLYSAEVCSDGAGKAVTGTASGLVGISNLSLGGASTIQFADGIFGVTGVPAGAQDFVGYSTNSGAGSDRMLVLRDQDIADGGDIGTIDFTANGFDPISATMTLGGLVGGESGFGGMDYATTSGAGTCSIAPLQAGILSGSSYVGMSAPASEQAADEYHVAFVSATAGSTTKLVREAFPTFADRTIALPVDMPVPTLTDITGSANYIRLQADFTLPAEFDAATLFDYAFGNYTMTVYATAAAMSGSMMLAMPDFSGLSGWTDAWGIPTGSTGLDYIVSGLGGFQANTLCTDGGRNISSTLVGTYN